jgi:hypothetical protein
MSKKIPLRWIAMLVGRLDQCRYLELEKVWSGQTPKTMMIQVAEASAGMALP